MRRCCPSIVDCSPVCNHCKAYRDDNPYYRSGDIIRVARGKRVFGSAGTGTCLTTGERTDPSGDCENFECLNIRDGQDGYK
jgi:hypothetical protein